MKKEVAELLKPSGLALDFRLAADNRGDQSFAGLVFLKFKGKCRVDAWTHPPTGAARAPALAFTRVSNGRILPFGEVKCDAVKQALSYLRPDTTAVEMQNALGLAMGRVVAHELYHVLARTTQHAARGLAQAAESLQDLVSARPAYFLAEDLDAIRRGLLQ
jgi:hypothetical protein